MQTLKQNQVDPKSLPKDVWSDLNNILDYENEREKEILDSFLGLIIHFEEEIKKSKSVVSKYLKNVNN